MSQFSLFGAAAADPTLADLDGLMLAGAQWVQHADAARLSVVVGGRWRADALALAFDDLGVGSTAASDDAVVPAGDGWSVRTGFVPELNVPAAAWRRGASIGPPPGLVLGAGGVRLWTIAAGHREDVGYLLTTPGAHLPVHQVAGAQLARHGLAAVSLAQRPGPGWRITSAKRVRRLAELLGPPPPGAGVDWPSA